jgi:hypothetical protein
MCNGGRMRAPFRDKDEDRNGRSDSDGTEGNDRHLPRDAGKPGQADGPAKRKLADVGKKVVRA